MITDCDDNVKGIVEVPSSIDGKTVVSIDKNAFADCEYISELILPVTLRSIGENAFLQCSDLSEITIPDNVTSIGASAFYRCNNLKKIVFPSGLKSVSEKMFYGCEKLEDVIFSESITVIGNSVFQGCASLKEIVLPEKLTSIGASCFTSCTSLEKIYLPESVKTVSANAFEKCSSLKVIYYQGSKTDFTSVNISSGNSNLAKDKVKYNHLHTDDADFITVDATCTDYGYSEYVCVCGYSGKASYITPLDHNLSEFVIAVEPGCESIGVARFLCSRCEFYQDVEIGASGHTVVVDEAVSADCYNPGKTSGSHCLNCGTTIVAQQEIPALNHDYTRKICDEAHMVSAATYLNPAVYFYTCSRCSAISDITFDGQKLVLGKTEELISSSTKDSITLAWKKVNGASGYGLYYKTTDDKWKLHKKIEATSYKITKLPSGRLYEFAVRAYVLEDGKTVGASSYTTIKEATKPLKPSKISAKQNEKAIQISWNACSGADGYRVYGYNTKTKSWVNLKSSTKDCKYLIQNLRSGVFYKFAVRSYIDTGSKIVWCDSYTSIVTATKPVAPVLKATSLKNSIRFTWEKVSGADGYIIYGSKSPNSGYVRLTTTTSLTYTKSSLESGKTYYFRAYSYKKVDGGYIYSYAGTVKAAKTK